MSTQGGRPSKCTAGNIAIIADGVRTGLSLEAACALADVGARTAAAWMQGKLMRHRRFQHAVQRAKADRQAELVGRLRDIQQSEKESVALDAIKFELDRQHRWTSKQAVEVSGPDSGPVRVKVSPMAALSAVAGAAAEVEGGGDEGADDDP